jgi:hypothetical protein
MVCSSTSKIGCGRLVYLLFPRFVNMFVSRLSGCVIVISLVVGNALLVDLLAVVLLNTFVSGLFVILLGSSCCLVDTLLDTLVFAGLSTVKCLHIGLLLSCAISFTYFILWSITGLHAISIATFSVADL